MNIFDSEQKEIIKKEKMIKKFREKVKSKPELAFVVEYDERWLLTQDLIDEASKATNYRYFSKTRSEFITEQLCRAAYNVDKSNLLYMPNDIVKKIVEEINELEEFKKIYDEVAPRLEYSEPVLTPMTHFVLFSNRERFGNILTSHCNKKIETELKNHIKEKNRTLPNEAIKPEIEDEKISLNALISKMFTPKTSTKQKNENQER